MWFLVEITINYDGIAAPAIWQKPTYDDALMSLFQAMASAIANPNVHSAAFMIFNLSTGDVEKKETWVRGSA